MLPSLVSKKFLVPTYIDLTNASMTTMEGPTMMKPSTYVNTIMPFPMYKQGSMPEGFQLRPTKKVFNFSYQL